MKSIGVLLIFAASTAFAASVCPIVTGGNADGQTVSAAYLANFIANPSAPNIGCNLLFTFNANGSVTITTPNTAISYDDGLDDNLVGVINNTGSPIFSIPLTSSSGIAIFGFDGDGICDPPGLTFSPLGAGGTTPCGTPVSGGYGHAGVTFSGISLNQASGTVNFAGGIPGGGGSNWFSLEGPADTSAIVIPPEPGTIILMGGGVAGLLFAVRRRRTLSR